MGLISLTEYSCDICGKHCTRAEINILSESNPKIVIYYCNDDYCFTKAHSLAGYERF